MNVDLPEVISATPAVEPTVDGGPLGLLPRLNGRQVRFDRKLNRTGPPLVADLVEVWNTLIGGKMVADRFDVDWRAAGLKRSGVVAQLAWPRLRTRVAIGIDPPLAHAVVDRLLGFGRTAAEARLQISPVEWGVLSFVVASGLTRLEQLPGPLGPWDLTIDRVGPDPFNPTALGPIVTWRWRVRVGEITGSARLWLPESLITAWIDANPWLPAGNSPLSPLTTPRWTRFDDLVSEFRAEVGTITLQAGTVTGAIAPGQLHLIDGRPLSGTVTSPDGTIVLAQSDQASRTELQTRVEPGSSGDRLIVMSRLKKRSTLRTPLMTEPSPAIRSQPGSIDLTPEPASASSDLGVVAVTLTVELGRVNLPLTRLAGLQPGDVIELARHSREPVDLSSNGRLVARGELVQVDTELGVRITQVFL